MKKDFYKLCVSNPAAVARYCSLKLELAVHLIQRLLTDWRLGGVSNREIDFGFGRGAVRVCVRACVRAKLCAGVMTMIPPGLGRNIGSLWGGSCPVPGPGARPPPGAIKN